MFLVYLLIVFFISLFIYQIILAFYPKIEGMTTDETKEKEKNKSNPTGAMYEEYSKDPLILGQQNAGNIEYLKGRVDDMSTNSVDISKMQTDMAALQQQMDDLGTQMTQLSGNMISQDPVDTSAIDGSDQTPVAGDQTTGETTGDADQTTGDGEEDEDQTTDMS